jgi:alkanesulfonate monooxygenase SsuD/methylene tetrahydromethanopterin reductase-like flavin-dependent oxidoreductase (luciferase family)
MKVGLILPLGDEPGPGVPASYAEISAMARDAEAGGLDSVWVYDHLPETWEAWTMLAALAAGTNTVELGTLVSCTSFRHPGLLAKMAHTVAEISGDRLTVGLGAGWHEPEYRAFGFPFDHRVDRFAESLEITATLLRDTRASFDGRYYRVRDAELRPVRAGPAAPRILVGCSGRPRMLGLVARYADAWNTAWYGVPGDRFATNRAALVAACEANGRDPASVELTVGMAIGTGDNQVRPEVDAVAKALAAWRDEGAAHVIAYPDPTNAAAVTVLCEAAARLR